MREIYRTQEYDEFFDQADEKLQDKISYIYDLIQTQKVLTSNFVKKLTNENLYEIRLQINNEYRILTFAIDHENIIEAKNILLISGFIKKSTKDYDKQIKKALKILEQWKDRN
ncbi:type II toxin-antitoxin system RelE/ParE family toxin [Chryseobacterium salivictor]|uniref:Phage-related protein n=1 Tax=Chryseobacterium salivictor TaxID=2547600 RepID=A0A4P6ZD31_9FLAO|nr:type II toxin-antitoxin system RelE/ParE family toxin [Chryseobacterium salivictor]QBO57450.1 hypothetical protein NBC122_00614 [Chryseobacterium salivictor]